MNIKKMSLLLIAISFLLFGCSSNSTQDLSNISSQTETIKIHKGSFYDLYPEGVKEGIDSYVQGGSTAFDRYIGLKLPRYNLKSLDDEKVVFPETNFIIEVSATFCSYCRQFSKELMMTLLDEYKDYPIIQYFYDGDNESINKFYTDIGEQIPDNLTVIQENKSLNAWLESKDIILFPAFIVVDKSGTITFVGTGSSDLIGIQSLLNSLKDFNLDDVTTEDGSTILEYIDKQIKVREYINNLDEIEVPSKIFDEEIDDKKGDIQNEKDNSDNCDKYCFNWMSKQATC